MEERILGEINNAVGKAIVETLTRYDSPLMTLTKKVISDNEEKLYSLINDEFTELLDSDGFKDELRSALNTKLAKTLIAKMGGELEKNITKLQSNPTTRARITLAIEQIVKEAT